MKSGKNNSTCILAVCGKGGVGKTSISAVFTKLLSDDTSNKVLAIDADPAVGLATALGIEPRTTVDDVRNLLIERVEQGKSGDKQEILALLDYEVFKALEEKGNLAFLAIGRPEREGCYCQVNEILKDIIKSIAKGFDYVVIDGEAGVEQVNRRVMENVNHLVLVSDASTKGINVVKTLSEVSRESIRFISSDLIVNRIRDRKDLDRVSLPANIGLLGWVPEDDTIRDFDIEGRSMLNLPECPALLSINRCLNEIKNRRGNARAFPA